MDRGASWWGPVHSSAESDRNEVVWHARMEGIEQIFFCPIYFTYYCQGVSVLCSGWYNVDCPCPQEVSSLTGEGKH